MPNDMSLPIEGADYFIHYMQLPPRIYAFITPNDDGTFTMLLDPRRDKLTQIDDWEHEIWHIIRDDFYNGKPIAIVEAS